MAVHEGPYHRARAILHKISSQGKVSEVTFSGRIPNPFLLFSFANRFPQMIVTDDEDGSDLFHDFPAFPASPPRLTPFIPNLPNDPTKLETELQRRGGR